MNIALRQAINKYAHQQGIEHAASLKQRLMAYAAELLEEGASNRQILALMGIPSEEAPEDTTADDQWSRCVIE